MKKKPKPEGWQARTKKEHEDAVIVLLKEKGTLRFKDILEQKEKTKIQSPRGLTDVLSRLKEKGLIEATRIEIELKKDEPKLGLHGERLAVPIVKREVEAYKLSANGRSYYDKSLWWLLSELYDLQKNKASYMHTISSKYYGLGLSEDVIMLHGSKDRELSFMIPNIPQIEDFIMGELFENIQKNRFKVEPAKGKFLLSFEFDFEELSSALIKMQSEGEKK